MAVRLFKSTMMFLGIDKHLQTTEAAIDDSGQQITYGELINFGVDFSQVIQKRTLVFILSENSIGALAGYFACIYNRIVPLLLSRNIERNMLENLINIYKPEFIWLPEDSDLALKGKTVFESHGFVLRQTGLTSFSLNDELSLLLTTSGSTGSPKLVRHSYANLEHNARNVAAFFQLNTEHRPIAILPMHYTMGLSVVNSHLYAGATILLMKSKLTDRFFWDFIRQHKASSFTGVPFSFEVLHKLRFFRMDLPHLTLLTQGGGKLNSGLFKAFAEYAAANNKKFIATYGQTEGTARMAWLPPELALEKTCSIGMAIPNGELYLVDENNIVIENTHTEGQMVYRGPNVTLGYSYSGEDLAKGDENNGIIYTGDIAYRDEDGCYYIVGRMKRFLKVYGFRISIDEVEQMIKAAFDIECLGSGSDESLVVYITEHNYKQKVKDLIVEKTGLFHHAVEIIVVNDIPQNEIGKPIFTISN